jgi:hypothetical protein
MKFHKAAVDLTSLVRFLHKKGYHREGEKVRKLVTALWKLVPPAEEPMWLKRARRSRRRV